MSVLHDHFSICFLFCLSLGCKLLCNHSFCISMKVWQALDQITLVHFQLFDCKINQMIICINMNVDVLNPKIIWVIPSDSWWSIRITQAEATSYLTLSYDILWKPMYWSFCPNGRHNYEIKFKKNIYKFSHRNELF